jgi:cytosine/adenosine deaminase-related metal-dependent hydrolase
VFGERGGSVDTVIVDGKVIVENGRARSIDEKAVLSAAKEILPAVRQRNVGVRAIAQAIAALE